MVKLFFLIIGAIFVIDYLYPDKELAESLPYVSQLGYDKNTFGNLRDITEQHLAVFERHEPADFFTNEDSVMRDLEQLPIFTRILDPISKKLIALKHCKSEACDQELAVYGDWLKEKIKVCDHNKTSNQCLALRKLHLTLFQTDYTAFNEDHIPDQKGVSATAENTL